MLQIISEIKCEILNTVLLGDESILLNFCAYHAKKTINTWQKEIHPQNILRNGYIFYYRQYEKYTQSQAKLERIAV